MKCIVELFGDDRNGRKMIAWGRRIGCADAGHVFDAERRKVPPNFSSALSLSTPICYTCFRHVEAIVYRLHLRHEHGRKRQGRVLRPCTRHAWPHPGETLSEADRWRLHEAQLFARRHPRLLKVGDTSFKSPKKASALAVCGSFYGRPTLGKL